MSQEPPHSHEHADEHNHVDEHGHDDAHDHEHADEHGHDDAHDHEHADEHGHEHEHGRFGWLRELLPVGHGHSHAAEARVDSALESSARGIWALKVSLLALAATAAFQFVIVVISGSAALLADTIHNFSDALTAVPLWLAFALSR